MTHKGLLQLFRYGFVFDLILYDCYPYSERIIKIWSVQGTTRSESLVENEVRDIFLELGRINSALVISNSFINAVALKRSK